MRNSMTAYGRASTETLFARWTMEISSVNRKGLELYLHLPPQFLFLDPLIRKWVGLVAQRGSIQIRLSCEMKGIAHFVPLLKNEKSRWEKVAKALKVSTNDITLSFLLEHANLTQLSVKCAQAEKEAFLVWEKSSNAWITMKKQEGKSLSHDIQTRVKALQKEIKIIEKDLPVLVETHLAKIIEKLKQFEIDSEALKKEAVLQASRDDVTEEVVRLKSHLEQMTEYLQSKEESVGRTLDFLAQEMGREVGTLMAKAGSSEIAKRAVHMKSEVEKIREQVQNIE